MSRAPFAGVRRRRVAVRAICVVAALASAAGCAKRFPPLPTYDTLRSDPAFLRVREEVSGFDASPLRGKRIVVDPGHGGAFPGVVGQRGTRESDVNLAVSLYLWGLLTDAGADVLLTRTEDRDFLKPDEKDVRPDLAERMRIANAFEPDLFVSVHHNADPNLHRDVNRTETYFKMTDPGPSLDVALRIHRRLVEALGILQNRLLPGNYFVLRQAEGTAVLGESAHLSNSAMEKRYRDPLTEAHEAEAYFRGMADYFRDGVPGVKEPSPSDTTLETTMPLVTARLEDDRGVAIDPLTVALLLDGAPVSSAFDPARGLVTYTPPAPIPNGEHRAVIEARNVRGNATPERAWRFRTASPPARVLLEVAPDASPARGPLSVTALVLDAFGQPVADSTEVVWSVGPASVASADGPPPPEAIPPSATRTRAGATIVYLDRAAGAPITASAGAASESVTVPAESWSGASGFCVDARDGHAIAGARIETGTGGALAANRDGYFAVGGAAETLRVIAPGYREALVPASVRVALDPVAGGALHGVRFAVDPEGGGDENGGLGPTSLRAADVNVRVAIALASMLEGAGARVLLTRDTDVPVSQVERVVKAEAFAPARYLRIGHRALAPGEAAWWAGHYPGSREGTRFAQDLAAALGSGASVTDDAEYTIQQTSAPAAFVNLGSIADPATERRLLSAAELRRQAYALYLGILAHFGAPPGAVVEGSVPQAAERAPSDAVVTLDGYLSLSPDSDGSFRFERVEPGVHRVAAAFAGGPRWERTVAADTTWIGRVAFGTEPSGGANHD